MRGVEVVCRNTGEIVTIVCEDEDQLMSAIIGTAKLINRAVINKGKSRSEQFVMVNQTRLKTVLDNPDFKGSDALVLLKLQHKVGYGNRIKITQKYIADELNIDKATVSRAFKKLKDAGVIYKDGANFKLSRNYAIKGKRKLVGTDEMVEKIHHTKTGVRLKSIIGGKA